MAGNAVESGRTVTSKVTAILMAFADGTGWSLSELARITNIPLTTTHRLVTELVAAQLLERSPTATASAGPGPAAPDRDHRWPDPHPAGSGRPRRPRRRTGRPVRLGVLRELRVTYVEKPGRAPTTSFAAGAQLPLHASALGKGLLAFAPSSVARSLVATGLPRSRRAP